MIVRISGTSYGVIEGGSLFQTERPHLWSAFARDSRKIGKGWQHVADISFDDADALERHMRGYGELLNGGGTDDDARAGREGRALLRDADRIANALDQ